MLNDFANEIEEIIHLAGGSNTTLAQVRQDLSVIVERMRAAQHRVEPTGGNRPISQSGILADEFPALWDSRIPPTIG